jgi:hypothetical protein
LNVDAQCSTHLHDLIIGGLHQKAILGCHEEGVRCRPVRGSAHGRVEGRLGGGTSSSASDDCGGPGVSGARGVVYRGTSGDGSVQGLDDTRIGASEGAHACYDEWRSDRRVGACDGSGTTSSCDDTHNALTRGGSSSLKVAMVTARVAGGTSAVAEATTTVSMAPDGPDRGRRVVAVLTLTHGEGGVSISWSRLGLAQGRSAGLKLMDQSRV